MAPPVGFKHSAQTRAKMSATHKERGFKITPEQREKMVAGQRVKAQTVEYREACSRARKGKPHSPETRAKMSVAHKGKIKTSEHCAAISAAKKGVPQTTPQTTEQREKNRQAQLGNQKAKGSRRTPEERAAKSKWLREQWASGVFDRRPIDWGRPGVHAGITMRCLNSEGGFARDCDEAGVVWQYEPRRFKLSWCTYMPDFYLPEFDIWVEVKGFPRQPGNWPQKVDSFRRETGKTLVVVFMSELSSPVYSGGG